MVADAFGIDGDDDALTAEFFRRFPDKFRPVHRAGVDRNFVGAGGEQGADVF